MAVPHGDGVGFGELGQEARRQVAHAPRTTTCLRAISLRRAATWASGFASTRKPTGYSCACRPSSAGGGLLRRTRRSEGPVGCSSAFAAEGGASAATGIGCCRPTVTPAPSTPRRPTRSNGPSSNCRDDHLQRRDGRNNGRMDGAYDPFCVPRESAQMGGGSSRAAPPGPLFDAPPGDTSGGDKIDDSGPDPLEGRRGRPGTRFSDSLCQIAQFRLIARSRPRTAFFEIEKTVLGRLWVMFGQSCTVLRAESENRGPGCSTALSIGLVLDLFCLFFPAGGIRCATAGVLSSRGGGEDRAEGGQA